MGAADVKDAFHMLSDFLSEDEHYLASSEAYGDLGMAGLNNALDVFKTDVLGANKSVDRPDLSVNFEELNDLMGMKELDELEKKYTGG